MALDPKDKCTEKKNKMQKERRSFLKRTAYAAPSFIVLGQLARPNTVKAEETSTVSTVTPPPGPGSGWGGN